MIANRKTTLERRIAKLESVLKNESVDFEYLSNSLRDSQDEISDASNNLYSKFRKFVSVRPSAGAIDYEIPEDAFNALSDAVKELNKAKEKVKAARRILDGLDY